MLAVTNQITINRYDVEQFNFYGIFSQHCRDKFGTPIVDKLHDYIPNHLKPNRVLKVGEDQSTYAHGILYQIDPAYQIKAKTPQQVENRGFIELYQEFVKFLEREVFHEQLVYQTLPTLRIHFPNNLSVGEYHRDRNYNHPLEEVNIWVPLTQATGTATIQMESSYDAKDFRPVEAEYGQYVIFDSGLMHGNEVNVEGYSRVSFDFRVIPISMYKEQSGASINQKMRFQIGDYYSFNH